MLELAISQHTEGVELGDGTGSERGTSGFERWLLGKA